MKVRRRARAGAGEREVSAKVDRELHCLAKCPIIQWRRSWSVLHELGGK